MKLKSYFLIPLFILVTLALNPDAHGQVDKLAEDRIHNGDSLSHPVDSSNLSFVEYSSLISQFLNFGNAFVEVEQSFRLLENYQIIRQQQLTNETMLSLRKSIKKRTYLAVGIGLISSSFFLLSDNGKDGGNQGLRYAGVGLSLSFPIYSLFTLKKQLNRMAPMQPINYSSLQNPDYPVTPSSKTYYQQYFKSKLHLIKVIDRDLSDQNQSIISLYEGSEDQDSKRMLEIKQKSLIKDIELQLIPQMVELQIQIKYQHAVNNLDEGSKSRLGELDQIFTTQIAFWKTHFLTN